MIELTWIVDCPHYYAFTQDKTHLILSWLNVYNYEPYVKMLIFLLKCLWPKFWTINCQSWTVAVTPVFLPSTRMRYATPTMTLQSLTHHPLTRKMMNHSLTRMIVATTLSHVFPLHGEWRPPHVFHQANRSSASPPSCHAAGPVGTRRRPPEEPTGDGTPPGRAHSATSLSPRLPAPSPPMRYCSAPPPLTTGAQTEDLTAGRPPQHRRRERHSAALRVHPVVIAPSSRPRHGAVSPDVPLG
jgi:hypothetical protein